MTNYNLDWYLYCCLVAYMPSINTVVIIFFHLSFLWKWINFFICELLKKAWNYLLLNTYKNNDVGLSSKSFHIWSNCSKSFYGLSITNIKFTACMKNVENVHRQFIRGSTLGLRCSCLWKCLLSSGILGPIWAGRDRIRLSALRFGKLR